MKNYYGSMVLMIIISILFSGHSIGQQPRQLSLEAAYRQVESIYGLDPVLINGKYFENPYRNDLGHPFYLSDIYAKGSISIHNKKIDTLSLNYNIFDQSLVISINENGVSPLSFIPPNEFISSFTLFGIKFSSYQLPGEQQAFYQEHYLGKSITCLSKFSKKRYDSFHNTTFLAHKYSEVQLHNYLILEGIPYSFKSNRSFVKPFEKKDQKEILSFLRKENIDLRENDSQAIHHLGTYCDSLLIHIELKGYK